jgi:putative nucleotidyltransferase with HDIG domain
MTYWAKIRPALLSIRTKLTLPYILLAILIAAGGGLVVSQVALNSLEERFANQLIETRKLASDSIVRDESDLLGTLRLLAHTSGMGEAIGARDRQKTGELAFPITFNAGEDAVLVLDQHGQLVLAIIKSESSGEYSLPTISDDLNKLPFVAKVVNQEVDTIGDKYSGISFADWGNYFFVSGPVKNEQGQFAGVILVGKSLNDLGRQIREETLSQATIYDLGFHPVSSTFPDVPGKPETAAAAAMPSDETQGLMRDLDIRNIAYTELLSPWVSRGGEKIGVLGTALPKAFLVRTSQITRFNITAITILAILLAMLFGVTLAESITRPILRLKQAASEVSGGNLGVRVAVQGGDEVAVLAQSFNTMVGNLRRSEQDLVAAYDKTIEGWSKALELRDAGTMGHTERVVEMTLALAQAMHVDERDLVQIRRGALLHDIGKMGIPDSILLKSAALTGEDWTIMKKHPVFAQEMLKQIEFLHPAIDIPAFHHEKWDGSGYPYGLAGKDIPLVARIFAVVDVWDALTSDRPYRKAWPQAAALQYIRENSGKHFDPAVVKAFMNISDVLPGSRSRT